MLDNSLQACLLFRLTLNSRIHKQNLRQRKTNNQHVMLRGKYAAVTRWATSRAFSTSSLRRKQFEFDYNPTLIRNFSVIAHVDHGKSTLSSRLLELTGTIPTIAKSSQILDKLQVEQERGITVKAQTCSMTYEHSDGKRYLFNLIDTPGHVDFRNEVSRSLAACQGCLLLVDASQGIQAQTIANFYLAFSQNLEIIPVLNKIDLPTAEPEKVVQQLETTFDIPSDKALLVSAKSNINIQCLFPAIINNISPPEANLALPLKALLIDSWYDTYLGVIALIRVFDGEIKATQKITSYHTGRTYDVSEVGVMHPERTKTSSLRSGQVSNPKQMMREFGPCYRWELKTPVMRTKP